ncbi:SDR family oxidoreductase [Desertivirga arenae]|uniref:SDR family oxidoreductase n=1 Tax=Desertivirga arenae TaxID=2810309 RepID=UPI001A969504|nr:NAD(P)-dependent oxidoreductase [Pedobacter sp. SYSU D00823]
MKTVLITGSNGLLGQKLISVARNSDSIKLIATSKGPNRYPFPDGYHYAEVDISDAGSIEKAIALYQPDVIINTAAITNVDTCHVERDLCRKVNVEAVKNLVEVCERYKIHLIHLSTDFVFDGKNGPYTEDATPNPVSYYGESKLDAEDLVRKSSSKWAIIRTVLVYGLTENMSRSNIVLWVKSSLEKGTPIKVVNDQWRTPTLAEDLALGCLLAAEKEAQGIYHISGKDTVTILEMAERVADFWRLDKSLISPVSSKSLNQEAVRPLKTGFILDKATRTLGYSPKSLEEGFKLLDKQMKGLISK